ncbi:putative peptidoglycan lipid II flippase [Granulicella rosea]|uniref:Putative peptidoglycan lipid II flippase n=1 Tax=Granulicella rosea TaxID=474952 RepID=A0A239D293_9BACT|nr:lipid II flippase MurJ [Granulicella rosea]SNS26138.1 putative peptidoglycan lipid II flippase [Granulicella rosea]
MATLDTPNPVSAPPASLLARLRPTGSLSAYAATLLLMSSSLLSGVLGLVRTKYIAHVFGAGKVTDAYLKAFDLPDMIYYFLVGGVASITLVTILNRYREAGDEAGADRALSIVLNAMTAVLTAGIVLAEIFTPLYVHTFAPKFDAETTALCISLTRVLLPAQLFFFVGGVLGSRLLVRKIFIYQAITPLIYNLGIILGGVFLSARYGIYSLAIGAVVGACLGSALLNALGVFRGGMRYHAILNFHDPAFTEWLRLSLPLIVGVSLTMADKWILGYYASADKGAITRLNTAKTLFNAPLSIIGFAAGAASLPFFSSLFAQDRMYDFNAAVSRSVSRLLAVSVLLTGWMIALAMPIVDLLRGGAFTHDDAVSTARYMALFAVSLALWAAQGIYARAFYAARNTLTPAISGTAVTLLSIPVYGTLFHHIGIDGLAIASDLGILAHTLSLAVLLHKKRLVSIASLESGELLRSLGAAILGFFGARSVVRLLPLGKGHLADVLVILAASIVWAGLCYATLQLSGSRLIDQLRRRGK